MESTDTFLAYYRDVVRAICRKARSGEIDHGVAVELLKEAGIQSPLMYIANIGE